MDDDLNALFGGADEEGSDDPFDLGGGSDAPAGGTDDLFASLDTPSSDDPFASLDSGMEDDPFTSLTTTPEAPAEAAPVDDDLFPASPPTAAADEEGDARPDWMRELAGFPEEEEPAARPAAAAGAPAKGRKAARSAGGGSLLTQLVGSGPEGMAFGMTAQQRMILAIFLFLDVSVLACMILVAIGAIFP